MSIITVERYKLLVGRSKSDTDERIAAFISIVESDFLAIRNHSFTTKFNAETGEEITIYPNGAEAIAYEMLRYKLGEEGRAGKVSETIGSYSYSMDTNSINGYPAGIVSGIERWASNGRD